MNSDKKDEGLVEVDQAGCRGKNVPSLLTRWLPIIGRYSQRFGIKIIVDIPNTGQKAVHKNEESTVYLHFNSYLPVGNVINKTVNPVSVFGQLAPKGFSFNSIGFGHTGMGTTFETAQNNHVIRSPEGDVIGFLSSKNIYIYPNVLSSWPNHEDIHILSNILYWTLLDVALHTNAQTPILLSGSQAIEYQNLKSSKRNRLFLKKKNEITKGIQAFLEKGTRDNIVRLDNDLSEINKEAGLKRNEYYRKLELLCELEERLALAQKRADNRDHADEFEKILAMDKVLSLRIVEGKIVVMTDRLRQIPNNQTSYDIGEFDIMIPGIPRREEIRVNQTRYSGEYQHFHCAGNRSICFGTSVADGLNHDIDKLIAGFEIAPLVHLILTFLQREATVPETKKAVHNTSSLEPLYKDVEDREKEKAAFIEFMKKSILLINTAEISKNLEDTIKKLDQLRNEREKLKLEAESIRSVLESIESAVGNEEKTASEEVGKFTDNGSILEIIANSDDVQIHFDDSRSQTDIYKKAKGYILRIKRGESLKIFYSSGLSPTAIFELLSRQTSKLSPQMERSLAKFQCQMRLYELTSAVQQLIADGLLDQ